MTLAPLALSLAALLALTDALAGDPEVAPACRNSNRCPAENSEDHEHSADVETEGESDDAIFLQVFQNALGKLPSDAVTSHRAPTNDDESDNTVLLQSPELLVVTAAPPADESVAAASVPTQSGAAATAATRTAELALAAAPAARTVALATGPAFHKAHLSLADLAETTIHSVFSGVDSGFELKALGFAVFAIIAVMCIGSCIFGYGDTETASKRATTTRSPGFRAGHGVSPQQTMSSFRNDKFAVGTSPPGQQQQTPMSSMIPTSPSLMTIGQDQVSVYDRRPSSATRMGVVPVYEARFMISVTAVVAAMVSHQDACDLDISGMLGTPLLRVSVRRVPGGKALIMSMAYTGSKPRVEVKPVSQGMDPHNMQFEITSGDVVCGILERLPPTGVEGETLHAVSKDDNVVMLIKGNGFECLVLTEHHEVLGCSTVSGDESTGQQFEIQVNPGIDAVLTLSCVLASLLLFPK